jgi:hypothetical protein
MTVRIFCALSVLAMLGYVAFLIQAGLHIR